MADFEKVSPRHARVADYAKRHVVTISRGATVAEAARVLANAGVTGAPVVDALGRALGVLSVTDLMALKLFGTQLLLGQSAPDEDGHRVPELGVYAGLLAADLMTPRVWSAGPDELLHVAAQRMIFAQVHRLVVTAREDASEPQGTGSHATASHTRGHRISGILSTLDLVRAVRDAGLDAPLSRYATQAPETVEVGTPVSVVARRLLAGNHTGMPIVDGGWPVGFLSAAELVDIPDELTQVLVEEVASPAMLCLPEETTMASAAAESLEKGIRRILTVHARQVTGILTSVDFARAFVDAATAPAASAPASGGE